MVEAAIIPTLEMEDVPDMTFSSSPVAYPPSSSPAPTAAPKQKRKLFQSLDVSQPFVKKPRLAADTVQNLPVDEEDKENDFKPKGLRTSPTNEPEILPAPEPEMPKPPPNISLGRGLTRRTVDLITCSGKTTRVGPRKKQPLQTYEQVIAERSATAAGRAKRAYYGIEIHQLIDDAKIQRQLDDAAKEVQVQKDAEILPTIEHSSTALPATRAKDSSRHQMWTEKYRARKFTELVGDERTHRSVLKWLKGWDAIVFPGSAKTKAQKTYQDSHATSELQHRKIMLLTGPPGLGKTTLAHVCARQAGYGVLEINASDDRSRDVVKGRIKDALGTETVRGIQESGKARKAGRPVCVIVDEVDGVVTGSGGNGGEGGFIKALIDLVQLDQRNSQPSLQGIPKAKRKGDRFRLLRPLILICNDVYAPSLRLLRSSSVAEIIHVRKPPLDKVIARLKSVFEKENIRPDNDAVRRLCEDTWGLSSRKSGSNSQRGSGDGDIRGVLVQGEWLAHKLKVEHLSPASPRLTRKWLEPHLSESSKSSKSLARGGTREVLERVFLEGAGLSTIPSTLTADEARALKQQSNSSNPLGVSDLRKRTAINALRSMIDTHGDHDRLMTDCFQTYPTQVFQDDTFLSKPNESYDWLFFHDTLSAKVHTQQEWELNPYLSTSACAFHNLFSSIDNSNAARYQSNNDFMSKFEAEKAENIHPFTGPKADFPAHEAEKANRTTLTELQSNFPAELLRLFSTTDTIAAELIPNLTRILAPDVKPVVIGGSGGAPSVASVRKDTEKTCVQNSVRVMNALGIAFEKVRIEDEGYNKGGFIWRMEPSIDIVGQYHVEDQGKKSLGVGQRYAVRQVMDQELRREKALQASAARVARGGGGGLGGANYETSIDFEDGQQVQTQTKAVKIKRDFFGRVLAEIHVEEEYAGASSGAKIDAAALAKSTAMKGRAKSDQSGGSGRIWVSFNEGFSNAVRKPISISDLMDGL